MSIEENEKRRLQEEALRKAREKAERDAELRRLAEEEARRKEQLNEKQRNFGRDTGDRPDDD